MEWVVNATPQPLYPRERPGTHCMEGWVGPTAGLDGCGKSRPLPGFDPRTVQLVATRYTDRAIPALPVFHYAQEFLRPALPILHQHTTSQDLLTAAMQLPMLRAYAKLYPFWATRFRADHEHEYSSIR